MIDWTSVKVPRRRPSPESRVPPLKTLAEAALGRRVPSLKALAARRVDFSARRPEPRLEPRTHHITDFDQLWYNQNANVFAANRRRRVTGEPLDPVLYNLLMQEAYNVNDEEMYDVPVVYDTTQPRPHHTRESSSSSASSSGSRRRSAGMHVVPLARHPTKGTKRGRRK